MSRLVSDTPRQAYFRKLVRRILREGRVPSDAELTAAMGWAFFHAWGGRIRHEEIKRKKQAAA